MCPTVSIILPTYNRTQLLSQAIESVLDQTYRDFELIVVDDGSEKDTEPVVDTFDEWGNIRYIRHKTNKGASAARNTGIEAATGEYIAFIDDDDEWLPTKLEKQVELMDNSSTGVGLIYCWMDYYEYPDKKIREVHPTLSGDIFEEMLDRQRIGNSSTLLVRAEIVENVGLFDTSLPRGNDGDFIRRITKKYKVDYVPEALVKYYTEHGARRITRKDRSGIRNHIKGNKAKFEKFETELKCYPRRAARIHADIGYHYALLNEWQSSIHHFHKAIFTAPYEPRIYMWLLRTLAE